MLVSCERERERVSQSVVSHSFKSPPTSHTFSSSSLSESRRAAAVAVSCLMTFCGRCVFSSVLNSFLAGLGLWGMAPLTAVIQSSLSPLLTAFSR